MRDEAINRVDENFYAAVELAPEKRQEYLSRACGGDPLLREEVEKKLSRYFQAEEFFQEAQSNINVTQFAGELASDMLTDALTRAETRAEKQIGPYKLIEKLGEGGCGVVYLAEQEVPVRRQVAFKIIKLGMDTRNFIARFSAELQALAMMDHPNIARVLDAGATERGRPYFVMELVRGVKITEFCDTNNYSVGHRLELFVKVCQAIQHAHQKGIIHRDIKPSNVLVTLIDGVATPKVIDFGIAKAINGGRLTELTMFTAFEHFVGTPVYMSPEQAGMKADGSADLDTRSDIYSLGIMLYELLTGKTPFDQNELVQSGFDEMRRTLREQDPHRPSAKVQAMGAEELSHTAMHRLVDPADFRLLLKGDLDSIVTKALEKDRNWRYETANGLAMDIQRYLHHEPVLARPPSRLYRFQKLVRRNRALFAAIGAVSAALLLGLGLSTSLLIEEHKERQRAVAAEQQQIRLRKESDRLRQLAEFHDRLTEATVARSRGKIEEADQLVAGIPAPPPNLEYAELYRTLGDWHAVNGRWHQATERFSVLVQVNQPDDWDITTLDYLRYAAALLESGDIKGYDRFRRSAVAHFAESTNAVAAERVIKVSLFTPPTEDVLLALQPLVVTASNSLTNFPQSDEWQVSLATWRSFSLALWEYRQGNYAASEYWHQKSLGKTSFECCLSFDIVLAMAHYQVGQRAQARSELAAARRIVDDRFCHLPLGDYWFDWVFPRTLLREATLMTESND